MPRTRNAFRSAIRAMLLGVTLSLVAIVAFPIVRWNSVDEAGPVGAEELTRVVEAIPEIPPHDFRRIAAAEPLPGLFGDHPPDAARPQPSWSGSAQARTQNFAPSSGSLAPHADPISRLVPEPRMAEAEIDAHPAERAEGPTRNASSASPTTSISSNAPSTPANGLSPSDKPAPFPEAASSPAPVIHVLNLDASELRSEILELRREVDRMAETHLRDQREEIEQARQLLTEMQNSREIDRLHEQFQELRRQVDAWHRETTAETAELRSALAEHVVTPEPVIVEAAVEPAAPPQEELRTQVFRLRHLPPAVARPMIQSLLTPGTDTILDDTSDPSAAPGMSERDGLFAVRGRLPVLDEISKLLAVMDVSSPVIEIEARVLKVVLKGQASRGVRQSLSDALTNRTTDEPVCPRCGKRHPSSAPVAPDCVLPEPTWAAGGRGWELAQFRGGNAEFLAAFESVIPHEVLAAPRIRVASGASAHVRLHDLMSAGPDGSLSENCSLLNVGKEILVRADVRDSGRIRLHIESPGVSLTTSESPTIGAPPESAEIVIQNGCTLVVAGLQAAVKSAKGPVAGTNVRPIRHADWGSVQRFEIVVLLTPRIVTEDSTPTLPTALPE